ncbi:hypothetical protein [Iningainema tapete]|uniref:Uncharacterized protein n=1 Tax=Iningainema tapete BLCC-T55 TaxID=2748662 RepID=A0A8J6XT06_9CYAN|nr:hypothetical protein [Iningainema tapete]MBD2773188.1 hypothetical protein [Iningainema tapete BLCC-T55]
MEFEKLGNNDPQKLTAINGKKGNGFTTNPKQMGSQALLPEAQTMLQGLFESNGLKWEPINMADPKFKDKVVAANKVAEVVRTNTAALPQMLKNVAMLMQGQVKLAEFYAASTQIVVDGKKCIDRATANAFLALADYQRYGQSLSQKVDRKIKALDAKYELIGELGEGKLQTSLKLIEAQKQAGEQRLEATEDLQKKRQDLLAATAIKRQKDKEYIRLGHLATAK